MVITVDNIFDFFIDIKLIKASLKNHYAYNFQPFF